MHNRNECKAELPNCVNCKGSHDATSKNLPRYLSEREICRIKVYQKLSFKEARINVSAGQRADASTARNSQDTMYSGGKNLSDIAGSNKNSLTKLKRKSCFLSLSQLMNSSLPNNNRYSPLQGTLDEDEATEDDCNLEETYASITARENANTIDSQGSITTGQRQQKVQYKRKKYSICEGDNFYNNMEAGVDTTGESQCKHSMCGKVNIRKSGSQDTTGDLQNILKLILPFIMRLFLFKMITDKTECFVEIRKLLNLEKIVDRMLQSLNMSSIVYSK